MANSGSGFESKDQAFTKSEFQRTERTSHQATIMPSFSKPTPSKWDDAQKWIASPTNNQRGGGGLRAKRSGFLHYRGRHPDHVTTKVVMEVTEDLDTKIIEQDQTKEETFGHKSVDRAPEPYLTTDSYTKPTMVVDSSVILNQHGSSTVVQSATAFVSPPSTVRSVSMRDMGTEMTPIASQEPSRTGTPVRATTPMRCSASSRPSSPGRPTNSSISAESANCSVELSKKELSERELQMKTRREIMVLGTKLGKMNIAAWASKGQEVKEVSMLVDPPAKDVIEIRAAAWEEAEKAKYTARFKREEMKIQAWENHHKAKIEAGMRKIEVEVESMRVHAHDKLMNKLATARHKAEEKRAAAENKLQQQAATTAQQAEYIRRTGRIPPFFSCCSRWS